MLNLNSQELDHLILLVKESPWPSPEGLLRKIQDAKDQMIQFEAAQESNTACVFSIVFKQINPIAAIKLYRSATGTGLREAHDYVTSAIANGKQIMVYTDRKIYENLKNKLVEFPDLELKICQ